MESWRIIKLGKYGVRRGTGNKGTSPGHQHISLSHQGTLVHLPTSPAKAPSPLCPAQLLLTTENSGKRSSTLDPAKWLMKN